MAKEVWKSVKGYEGLYEVSDLGNVRSLILEKGQTVDYPAIPKQKEFR